MVENRCMKALITVSAAMAPLKQLQEKVTRTAKAVPLAAL
jgi:hypothetical protein